MTKKKNSLLVSAACLSLLLLPAHFLPTAKAEGSIDEQQQSVQDDINQSQAQLDAVKQTKAETDAQIKALDMQVTETATKIRDTEDKINTVNQNIADLEVEIADLQQKIIERDQIIRERLVLVQENGWESRYAEVLFGSASFGEFIERMDAVSSLVSADQDIIEDQMNDQAQLETSQKDLEDQKAALIDLNTTYTKLSGDLQVQKAQKEQYFATLSAQEAQLEGHILDQKEQEEILAAQEKAMAQLAQAGTGTAPPIPIDGSPLVNPTTGTVTSPFGARDGEFHYGMDIANSADVPIYAAGSGVVARSYYSTSYGNCVIISHTYNGKTYSTLYAHMQARFVEDGQVVTQGQQIGIMGNTGDSYGQHLHFELMNGGWQADHSNCFDPAPWLNY